MEDQTTFEALLASTLGSRRVEGPHFDPTSAETYAELTIDERRQLLLHAVKENLLGETQAILQSTAALGTSADPAPQDIADASSMDAEFRLPEKQTVAPPVRSLLGSALLVATRYGRLNVAELLLEAGADVNAIDNQDRTMLRIAAKIGRLDLVELALRYGGDMYRKDMLFVDALTAAAGKGHFDIVERLLHQTSFVEWTRHGGRGAPAPLQALALASEKGDSKIVELLLGHARAADDQLRKQAEAAGATGKQGGGDGTGQVATLLSGIAYKGTALHHAAAAGQASVVQLLLDAGTPVDVTDAQGGTPLHVAAGAKHHVVCDLLLRHGATINAKDGQGNTPLHRAAVLGAFSAAELLTRIDKSSVVEDQKKLKALLDAMSDTGCDDVIALLLAADARVDAPNLKGRTPLHMAAECGRLTVVKLLSEHRSAALNHADLEGNTALHLACSANRPKVVDCLLSNGASHDIRNVAGRTALQCAIAKNSHASIKRLVAFGARHTQGAEC